MSEISEKLPVPNDRETLFSKNIIIDGKNFTYVKSREFSPVSIYVMENLFLKTGPKDVLIKELDFQKHLFELGFPVPKIIAQGEDKGMFYFIEESLGKNNLENIFLQDTREHGEISNEHFSEFMNITKIYTISQIKTSTECEGKERFTKDLLRDDEINTEIPSLTQKTNQAVKKALDALSVFPTVLTHGDFHPANLFPKGVIDLEGFALAPIGYDLLANIYSAHILIHPGKKNVTHKMYSFTRKQINQYLDEIDKIFIINELPKPSEYKNHFIFLRLIWATVRMQRWPKTQTQRYELYDKILSEYLKGGNIENLLVNY
ncbi:hypothetical protein A2443_00470 [Candidatus Nomurabacteria bacterium RIFOXYC2_FULL_43_16]|uniref:Aminoglycoside phosphotransferase domain-containing protein n=2 Tax=Candidatus Nomuraibacteriota TaxID=1752729 RepID=A0A0G1HIM8_9BACT|nr:hypothetical protein [uncultured bacterium]KKR00191.1 MAG: hypothetical protein UT27_C0021G0005 [Candidatus Nomurabacteria bacterium GW2011_GWD2_39_12]KKS48835.1 MAG: hypothetical protein UV13_C0011G0029 [Parcubacteria group bacterium GW2011_GWC1_42_21]KKS58318.1 MAG: hypothetical protein UV23_C0011G0005 [Candidatus Nomurabacteria bacterium GW2011_GWF1_42_40]KKS99610.1 MAG: hypothetical protein UV77_C0011G0016 [Candidatus Nomurabacteria bacterium GW2011_GWA1_43_17]KKT10669.1 MAG: hypothetic